MNKGKKYCQLNQYHRKNIDEFLRYKYSLSEIALNLGFDKSTISREIKRNLHNGKYYFVKAQKLTKKRQSEAIKSKR
ncbi:MAG: helix-turn-helix domain-containing protein [Candidatus Delongbacteria bacterium]|nr:helix-turn-helix domain-containing protein [Candidatus Delongbacteria bacterium]